MTPENMNFGRRRTAKERRSQEQNARSLQAGFTEGGFQDYVPEFLMQTEAGSLIESALGESRTKALLTDRGLFADLRETGVIQEVFDKGELNSYRGRETRQRRKHQYGLVTTGPLNEGSEDQLSGVLCTITQNLLPNSPVYVVEQRVMGERPDKSVRDRIMGDAGLVDRKVLTGKPESIVWRARTEKDRGNREGVDLTQPDNRNYNWARRAWKTARENYRRQGYTILDPGDSEILSELRSSKNVPDTIHRLRSGYGMIVVDRDGNRFRVSLGGIIEPLVGGPEHGDFGLPKKKGKRRK